MSTTHKNCITVGWRLPKIWDTKQACLGSVNGEIETWYYPILQDRITHVQSDRDFYRQMIEQAEA